MNHFDYFSDIENLFIKRRGKHLLIGPLDWSLIESWEKRGVPLKIVLRSIDEVFDACEAQQKDTSEIRSLKYCNDAVEKRFSEWNKAQAGKSREAGTKEPAGQSFDLQRHIKKLSTLLSEQVAAAPGPLLETLKKSVARLDELAGATDQNLAAKGLERIDAQIDIAILENKKDILTEDIRQTALETAERFGIDAESSGEDFERILCKSIRDAYQLPNVGLYKL